MTDALAGGFADAPVDAALAFRAALDALARPGRIGRIGRIGGAAPPAPLSAAAGALLLTLCDRETPPHLAGGCDCAAAREWIAFHVGAPLVGRGAAMFALGDWAALTPLDGYPIGRPEYPARSCSLIVEVGALSPDGAVLRGPGIEGAAALSLPEIAAFRANAARFPLGLDFWFTCGDRLAALPRSTRVEAA